MDHPLLDGLNDAQRRAVTHGAGPLLIVAGPGSGKTRVVSRRVAWLLDHGVRADQVLAVTFTNKAAAELRERVAALVPSGGLWVSTFHSACARILRDNHAAIGFPSHFTIYDEEDRRRLAGRALREAGVPADRLRPGPLVRWISARKGKGETPADAAKAAWGPAEEDLAKAWERYERLLVEAAAMDFDDLLSRTRRLLDGNPGVLEAYRRRLAHVLVDEYQDTNAEQFRIARALSSGTRNLCATGDPDQSIYGWRGADIRNILDFESHYPDAAVVRLEENYRSTGNVLRAAGTLISRNADRREKALRGTAEAGPEVRVEIFEGSDEEGEGVGEAVAALLAAGVPPNGIAVLYRVNARSRAVEHALRVRRVPYRIVRGVEFFQRAEVKDLVAWLRLLANPRDGEAFARILEAPRRGAGEVARGKVLALAEGRGIPVRDALLLGGEACGVAGKAARALDEAAAAVRSLAQDAPFGVATLLERIVGEIGYREWLEHSSPDDHQERWENVEELIASARAHDRREGGGGLAGFLEEAALASDQDGYDADEPRVALMTLHACKGLEFPAVLVVGVEEGVLPHGRAAKDAHGFEDAAGIEEERRLLFVGMTRARRHLWLSASLRPSGWAGGGDGGPSRFLDEIGADGVRRNRRGPARPAAREFPPARPAFPARRAPFGRRGGDEGVDDGGAVFEPDAAPDLSGAPLRPGQRVRHAKFGNGRVRALEPHGRSYRAVVEFREGRKTLDLDFTRLEPLGEGS